jgi:hypothetical protein
MGPEGEASASCLTAIIAAMRAMKVPSLLSTPLRVEVLVVVSTPNIGLLILNWPVQVSPVRVLVAGAASIGSGALGMTAKLADSDGEGEILFDIAKGRVQKTSFKTEMPMTLSVSGPAGSQINSQGLVRSTMVAIDPACTWLTICPAETSRPRRHQTGTDSTRFGAGATEADA